MTEFDCTRLTAPERDALLVALYRQNVALAAPYTLERVATPDTVVPHTPLRCGQCGESLHEAPVVDVESRHVFDVPVLRLAVTGPSASSPICLEQKSRLPARTACEKP